MSANLGLDDAALQRVAKAVAEAEERTAGEIVTYIVGECDPYPEAGWTAAVLGALTAVGVALVAHQLGGWWGGSLFLWGALPATIGAVVGYLLGDRVPPIKRLLIQDSTLERRFALRAESAFLEEEVFDTRDRSGILIFLALFEHRALVLGDKGINNVVERTEWQGIVGDLVAGIRQGDTTGALERAVEQCGELLELHGVEIRPDDVDELPDAPRVRPS